MTGINGDIFSVVAGTSANLSSLSGGALSRGIDSYIKKDYETAAREFRRAAGLAPGSENALNALDFLAQSYLQLERPADAESAYRQAVRLYPDSADMRIKLGNLYFSLNRYQEAEAEYQRAVRISPRDPNNLYSLGQLYLSTNRLNEAEQIFGRILSIAPDNYGTHYALGQTHARQGKPDEAIRDFKKSIELNSTFAYAYLDLGMTYADQGRIADAEDRVAELENIRSPLSTDLRNYIEKVRKPGMFFASSLGSIIMSEGPGTTVSSLDSSLAAPNASKDFTLTVYFDKTMDRASVENILNWQIDKADGTNQGGAYNWGHPAPSTDIGIFVLPKHIYYDAESFSADVTFTITQNSTGTGTIDPSHLVFGFSGKDAYGNTMDTKKDEYLGLSIIV